MSETEQRARKATHELQITEEAHAAYRQECIDKAVALANEGMKDEAYTKLLMVVAIDAVRQKVLFETNDAAIERANAEATQPKPN